MADRRLSNDEYGSGPFQRASGVRVGDRRRAELVHRARWVLARSLRSRGMLGRRRSGLLDFAMFSSRHDPHTLAHLAALHANVWALECFLDAAGRQIDENPNDHEQAPLRALQLRHLVEQACTDSLRPFVRAYGPYPLSMDAAISRRCHELDLYLRQCHGERDLESLGRRVARL